MADDYEMLGREIATIIKAENAQLRAEIYELRLQVKSLSERPQLKYYGVWETQKTYPENALTTKDGSLWIAKRPTTAHPGVGVDADDWQLCVRKGRDGKDLRA